jgi:hypothetical protein
VQQDGGISSNFVSHAIDFRQKESPDGKILPRKDFQEDEKNIDDQLIDLTEIKLQESPRKEPFDYQEEVPKVIRK